MKVELIVIRIIPLLLSRLCTSCFRMASKQYTGVLQSGKGGKQIIKFINILSFSEYGNILFQFHLTPWKLLEKGIGLVFLKYHKNRQGQTTAMIHLMKDIGQMLTQRRISIYCLYRQRGKQ